MHPALRLARRGRFGEALRSLEPSHGLKVPKRLDVFYTFVTEQDLLRFNPARPKMEKAAREKILSALKPLKFCAEKQLLEGFLWMCAPNYARAARVLGEAAKRFPGNSKIHLLLGAAIWLRCDQRRTRLGLFDALEAAEKAIALGETGREAYLLRAQIRLEFEDNEAGLADLNRILKADAGDIEVRIGKAEVLTDMYRYRPALREIGHVMREHPGTWWAFAHRARLRGICGYLDLARRDFKASVRKNPNNGAVRSWYGELLRKLGRQEEALEEFNRAIELDPYFEFGWECRGRLRLSLGDVSGALEDLDQACRLDPAHLLAFVWRGEARLKKGMLEEAWQDFEFAAPLEPRTTWNAPLERGQTASREKRETAFWKDLDACVRTHPGHALSWLIRGRFKAVAGKNLTVALSDLERAARLAKRAKKSEWASWAGGWQGFTLLRLGNPAGALKKLQGCLRKNSPALFRAWKARAYAQLQKWDQARSEYDSALKRPQAALAEAFLESGYLHSWKNRWDLAKKDYEKAFLLSPRGGEALQKLKEAERFISGKN